MSPSESCLARSAAYDLLARFFRSGLTQQLFDEIDLLPGLRDALPETIDPDALAADHFALLGLDVFPYASAYLEADGRPGGTTTDFVSRMALSLGETGVSSESSDHISAECDVLSRLCMIKAEMIAGCADLPRVVRLEHDLLDHLFQWLPVFKHALEEGGGSLHRDMAEWMLDIAVDHKRSLASAADEDARFQLPELPDLLSAEKTGLRDLAEYLCRPALAGMVVTRTRVEQIARDLGLPRGFGDRSLMLGNLFGAAGNYGVVAELITEIKAVAIDWQRYFESLESSEQNVLAESALAWSERVGVTLSLLDHIDQRVSDIAEST
ncbi:MAG: molecular chaperone TorD family protein [Rhodothermales bacterium]|nr:molecular chaperone TorD family protein [Rhodothermales bacterium]